MDRKASVIWNGTLREGTGTLSTESGVLADTQYSFRTRFAEGRGTNPDELIAASLGGCFSMALSNELGLSGFHPQRIETTATATLEDLDRRLDADAYPARCAREAFRMFLKRSLWKRRSRPRPNARSLVCSIPLSA